jgi:hypothetical protein
MTPLTGVVFVVILVVGQVLLGNEPGSSASAAKVVAFYSAHRGGIRASSYLTGLSLVFGLFFYGYLRDHIRRFERSTHLAAIAFGGAVLFAVGGALGAGTQLALADTPRSLSPAAAQALNLLQQDVTVFAIAGGVAGLLIASGLAIVRGRQLPTLVGWLGLVLGVVSLAPVRNVGAPLAGVWTLVVSILLWVRTGRLASESASGAGDTVASTAGRERV